MMIPVIIPMLMLGGSNARDWIDVCLSSRLLQPLHTDAAAGVADVDKVGDGAEDDGDDDNDSETGDGSGG